jgi:phospholipid/cholesterol/gamma-HCH transport system substrate-binding protein
MPELQNKNIKLKVGLTIFIGLVILLGFTIMLGTDDFVFSKTYSLYLYTDNTSGLTKGATVTLGGYKVGDVASVDFVPSNTKDAIKIKIRILKEYQTRITTSSRASISSIGILGDKLINITLGDPSEQPLADNATIPIAEGVNLERIAGKLTPGIDKLNNILNNISSITDSISSGKGSIGQLIRSNKAAGEISSALNNINSLIADIRSRKGSLGQLMNDDKLYTNLTHTSENIALLTENINHGKGTLGQLVVNDSLYHRINNASIRINSLLAKVNQDSSVFNGLVSDKNLYKKLNIAIENLNNLTTDIKEHPERYVKVSVF